MTPAREQRLSLRFEVLRNLGEGAFGSVDEVLDRQSGVLVARKTLRSTDAAAIAHFKEEFRTLCRLVHPGLVTLFELFVDDGTCFYTMEVVDGVDLVSWVRPGAPFRPPQRVGLASPGPPYDARSDRIRSSFAQLSDVLGWLHRQEVVHGDVKPANALVRTDGVVKLLDIGLMTALGGDRGDVLGGPLFGTPDYLAPEIGRDGQTPACDLYALGVMLYEALTGQRPFAGAPMQVIAARQMLDPLRPSQVAPGVPDDLDALCVALLDRDPARRPDAGQVLGALGAPAGRGGAGASQRPRSFVGRQLELAAMDQVFAEVAAGACRAMAVYGTSGMGKTALVQRFVDRLDRRRAALVLRSRCYEREDLPFKAVDGIMDALGRQLSGMPAHQRDALDLWPETAVARLFPQLQAAEPAPGDARAADPGELRREAFHGVAKLLGRVARIRPVVMVIDDLQWGDADSAALVEALLEPPGPERVLVLGCYRTGGPVAQWTSRLLSQPLGSGEVARVEVGALPLVEATSMALERLAEVPAVPRAMALAPRVAREAGGCPYFIEELARHVRSGEPVAAALSGLDDAIGARVDRLPASAREVLEVIACAGRPVPESLLAGAVGRVDAAAQLTLEAERLARIISADGQRLVEAYHDRVRETIVARLPLQRVTDVHASLARAYLQSGATDPEILLVHHEKAGDIPRAVEAARRAALRARDSLAFDEAARLWALAAELYDRLPMPGHAAVRTELLVELAQALVHAGRGPEAAGAYLRACEHAPEVEALELRRRAAERLLFSGHVEAGREAVQPVLDAVGLPMPRSRVEAAKTLVALRPLLRALEPLSAHLPPAKRPVSEREAVRMDVCRSLASGFALVDPLMAGVYQARYCLLAARSRDPLRLAHSMAVGLPFIAAEGVKNRKRVERQRRRMRELVERHGDPYLRSFADSACGAAAWLHGEWSEARRLCLSATEGLLNCSPPPLYEVANTWLLSAEAASWSGDFAFIGAEIHGWLARARAWGDRHLQCTLTARFVAMGHLVAGSPDRAERAVERAVREWPATGVATLTLWAAVSRATAALYRGEPRRALDGLLTERPRLRNAGLLQVELYRLMFCDLIGRSASAVAQSARGVERARLLVMVERQAGELLSSGAPWAKGLGEVLRAASLWHLTCDAAARRQLRVAARSFRARGMRVHALSALRQEATSRGAAPTDVAALDAELAALGIAEPERVAALTVPVFV